jgi:DEAD/DEAH box helicase domain-containing protein
VIPSVIGAQVRRGIKEFLQTTFPVTNPYFAGALEDLLERQGEVFRGPYISLKLPFTASGGTRQLFPGVLPEWFRPFRHQEQAWERLDWRAGKSTVVATGTGSGKTECFLYPLLDYCSQQRGRKGIKAILIYPMNALATDQAGRIAETIYRSNELRGRVTAGLYLGKRDGNPTVAMTESRVITHRDVMRDTPPDILLTNYKMLDYLLLRPKDLRLWRENGPETLRYVVVDELHTFDGAQGADVACLIRRLKERLKTPPRHLICVGTSATLGSDAATSATQLVEYARKVFGEVFEPDSVIDESVQTPAQFLAGAGVRYAGAPGPEAKEVLNPLRYSDPVEYLLAQRRLWFGDAPGTPELDEWRTSLAAQLRAHGFLRRLLDAATPGAVELANVFERLSATLPTWSGPDPEYVELVLGSFLALLSVARVPAPNGLQPLVQVRYQFWIRELARVVSSVGPKPEWAFAADLKSEQLQRSLAVIHCRQCGLTGWTGTVKDADDRLNPDLDTLYRTFFDNRPEVRFLFPGVLPPGEQLEIPEFLCPGCLHFVRAESATECSWCGMAANRMIQVWMPDTNERVGRGNETKLKGKHDCPACESHNSLAIVGSRAASLISVLISQLWASPFNPPEKKLLAFSDNVQDASHRAGFFKARTFRFNLRTAIQKVVQGSTGPLALTELPERFFERWEMESGRPERFVATFLPPDMEWLEDYERLRREGALPAGSDLLDLLRKRLDWEIWGEYTHNCRIGRSLEKTGSSTLEPRQELLETAAAAVRLRLQNEVGGLRDVELDAVRRFLHGFLLNLKNRGGVWHPEVLAYAQGFGNTWQLSRGNGRDRYMPRLGPQSRLPEFLVAFAVNNRFLPLVSSSTSTPSWHTEWLRRAFGRFDPDIGGLTHATYRSVIEELCRAKLMAEVQGNGERVWGVALESLDVTQEVRQLRCERCSYMLSAGPEMAAALAGGPCLHGACRNGVLREQPQSDDYYGRLYQTGDVARIFAAEHTGLLTREVREAVEIGFEKREKPGDPNLLSCTPTLEMGVDIGDLSSVAMCSVPPKTSNYLQRAGRAGRKHGNAFIATVANARPHDLFFFLRPDEMLRGHVEPPGCYLNASAVLERQLTAYAMDRWVETGLPLGSIPDKLAPVLDAIEKSGPPEAFPWNLLTYFDLNRTALENGFLALFGAEVSDWTRDRLLAFSRGEEGLRYRMLEGLRFRARESKNWRNRVQTLNKRIRDLREQPMREEDRENEINELSQEKSAIQVLIASLRDRNVLNFLTDEGLLPNYAFPEQGITLQSVIYRQKRNEPDPERRFETRTYEYVRPAAAAIAELAPANSFYAEGRKVRVDGVVFEREDLVVWRLCPNCTWMEREGEREFRSSCPKCGHTMWQDEGQRKTLLRMREVMANTEDRASRSFDESDDREPMFYDKNMFVLKDDADVAEAWHLDCEDVPFGFEFFRKITLREINFGPKNGSGSRIQVAGRERTAKSFELCEACGRVRRNGELVHSPWCRYRKDPEKEKSVRACFLYREFTSEAIRMLLPVSATEIERHIESFVAALELGLRKKFQGDPGHLNTTVYDEPIEGSESRRRYLVLYDGVPGGTGYLKELMRDPSQLHDVLGRAYDALSVCECRLDERKDGCYICLLAYRGRHFQGKTSRTTAIKLLGDILENWGKLKTVDRLETIRLNRVLESDLEASFLEALRRNRVGEAERFLSPQVVNGKQGWYLKIPSHGNWLIEPQVELGPEDRVRVPSRADFVLYPERPFVGELPIAVFTDGFEYHADPISGNLRTGVDSAQRLAIARSGRYRVWSLTWSDVHERLDKPQEPVTPLGGPPGQMLATVLGQVDAPNAAAWVRMHGGSSFDLLLHMLGAGRQASWNRFAHATLLQTLQGDRRQGPPPDAIRSALQQPVLAEGWSASPAVPVGGGAAAQPAAWMYRLIDRREIIGIVGAAISDIQAWRLDGIDAVLRLMDDRAADLAGWKPAWREFLRMTNILQFTAGAVWVTTLGLRDGIYGSLLEEAAPAAPPIAPSELEVLLADVVDEGARIIAIAVYEAGKLLPEPGYELMDGSGEIVGMAELAWVDARICVLTEAQDEFAEPARNGGWTVFTTQELKDDAQKLLALLPSGN